MDFYIYYHHSEYTKEEPKLRILACFSSYKDLTDFLRERRKAYYKKIKEKRIICDFPETHFRETDYYYHYYILQVEADRVVDIKPKDYTFAGSMTSTGNGYSISTLETFEYNHKEDMWLPSKESHEKYIAETKEYFRIKSEFEDNIRKGIEYEKYLELKKKYEKSNPKS